MADQPMTNGPAEGGKYIDTIDPDDPEYIKQMRRPAEVKEDVNQMESRKRVNLILNSQAFRDELEQLVDEQLKSGSSPSNFRALQQLSELLTPYYRQSSGTGSNMGRATGAVIPIADLRGVDSMNYSKGEKLLRCKLASLYRLMDLFGWSQNIQGVVTSRIGQDLEHFLTAPYGLLYHEITAASLVKLDMQGDILETGSTPSLGVNKNSFLLNAAIHAARPDIRCIIHLRSPQAIALSSMKGGLLPISQEAVSVGEPSYYTYNNNSVNSEELDKLARAIGPANKVLILRNQGVVVGGESVDEAFMLAKNIVTATETQLQLLPIGVDNILLPTDDVRQQMYHLSLNEPQPMEDGRRKWRRGELQFEAFMRHLDNAGYRTGHIYHEPNLKKVQRMERANSEVEIPPTSSSFQYYNDDGKFSSPLKTVLEKQKKQQKTDWLNTPNTYKKEQIDEIGTPTPKKITKWVEDKSNAKGMTPVKIENPNQFAPQGQNPKELQLKYKEIKKEYYEEKIDAGPQSRILEGTTWEEAQKINEGGGGDKVIMVGAASKGIIQKDHQHNATVYKTYYAQNPFDSMTEDEINKYQQQVQKGGSGEPVTIVTTTEERIEAGPDGKLISTEERMIQVRQGQGEPGQQDPPSPGGQSPRVVDIVDAAGTPQQQPDSLKKKKAKKPESLDFPAEEDQDGSLQRTQSARYPDKSPELIQELENQPSFEREKAKSERKAKKKRKSKDVNGEQLGSPTKSTSSGDGTLDERSSREGSPSKEPVSTDPGSPEKGGEKKKKKFRMPSFSKAKKDKKPAKQSAV